MIVELSVENLAIIERCDLALGPGFTVLTGETGAGKSLLVDALELAFGSRAEAGLVRSGSPRALVSVTLDLSERPEIAAKCAELGAELEDKMLFIQREVFAEGKSQCRIGGRLSPVSTLKEIGKLLVDLHGQHDHQSLLDPRTHLGFLDAWIGAELETLQADLQQNLDRWLHLEKRLLTLRGNRRDREQKVDLLRFQVQEIEAIGVRNGELEDLEHKLGRLKHAEQLAEAISAVRERLLDGDVPGRDQISASARILADAERLDPVLKRVREPLDQATILLDEALSELRSYEDAVDVSPGLLEETAARLDSLKRLLRKYGDDESAVLSFLENARAELELLVGDETDEEALASSALEARSELERACAKLSELRKEKASFFSQLLQEQLRDLAMEKAQFSVSFQSKEPDPSGADVVEFLFTANAGEPVRPLSKIASGGEISRVMLAIKTALMGKVGVPTLIFDEVDVGLGGRAAATVARKLEELADHDQVLVITHLPQIAGRATAHYRIEKAEISGRAVATALSLNQAERIEEIARMLAGEEVGSSALKHAEELLGRA